MCACMHMNTLTHRGLQDRTISKLGFPGGSGIKNPPAIPGDARDSGLIPGSGRSPEAGNGNPFQYPPLGNPMDRGV